MKIHGSVVSLSFIFPHPPENEKQTHTLYYTTMRQLLHGLLYPEPIAVHSKDVG